MWIPGKDSDWPCLAHVSTSGPITEAWGMGYCCGPGWADGPLLMAGKLITRRTQGGACERGATTIVPLGHDPMAPLRVTAGLTD